MADSRQHPTRALQDAGFTHAPCEHWITCPENAITRPSYSPSYTFFHDLIQGLQHIGVMLGQRPLGLFQSAAGAVWRCLALFGAV
jgi:hypothetical protein